MNFLAPIKYYAAVPLRVWAYFEPFFTGAVPLAMLDKICRFTEHPADILVFLNAMSEVGGFKEIESYYYDALRDYKDARFMLALGHHYLTAGNTGALKRLTAETRQVLPDHPELLYLELTIALKEMNEQEIRRLSGLLVADKTAPAPASYLAYNCKCWDLLTSHDYAAAQSMAEKILQVGESTVARVALGTAEHIAGNELAAAQHYAQAAEVQDSFPLEPLMAQACYIRGDMKSAAKYLREAQRKKMPVNDNDETTIAIMASEEYREL